MYITDDQKARLVVRRIKHQFPARPNGQLYLAVVDQAIRDIASNTVIPSVRFSALRYINEEMMHAEVCGVDSEWIRNSIIKAELSINR